MARSIQQQKVNLLRTPFAKILILVVIIISLFYALVSINYHYSSGQSNLWRLIGHFLPFSSFVPTDFHMNVAALAGMVVLLGLYLIILESVPGSNKPSMSIAFLGILAVYLGCLGVFVNEDFQISFGDAIYQALGLFSHASSLASTNVPWTLNLARFLGLVVTIATVLAIAARRFVDWLFVRLTFKPRVIICGLGWQGKVLVENFIKEGYKVIVIEVNKDDDQIREMRSKGVTVFIDNASDRYLLKFAGINRASYLIVVTGNDETNIDIASETYHLREMNKADFKCFVHVQDVEKGRILKRHQIFSSLEKKFDARIFNINDISARMILDQYPPDKLMTQKPDHSYIPENPTKIMLAGDGKLAFAMLQQMAGVCHYSNLKSTVVRVIQEEDANLKNEVTKHLPDINQLLDLEYVTIPEGNRVLSPELEEELYSFAVLYLCFDDEILGYRFLTKLIQHEIDKKIKIVFCLPQSSNLTMLLHQSRMAKDLKTVKYFWVLDETCNRGVLTGDYTDLLAQKIHNYYKETNQGPNSKDWSELEEEIRDSNRNVATHWQIKKRAIQYLQNGTEILKAELTPSHLEILAQMEHRRWYAEKVLAGYVYAKEREENRREHPCLVDWNELLPEQKKKDEDSVLLTMELDMQ
jgi:hypothetical protein